MTQDSPRCIFCDSPAVGHHLDPKGMGSTRDPVRLADMVPLCERCHVPTLHDQPYVLERTVEGSVTTYRLVSPDGMVTAERRFLDGFGPEQEGNLVSRIELLRGLMTEDMELIPYLSHEGLVAAAEQVHALGKAGWMWQAYLAHTAYGRMPWGSREEKRNAICAALGIRRQSFYDLLTLVDSNLSFQSLEIPGLSRGHVLLAAKAPDPQAALEMAQDRASGGRYTIDQFRADLGLPVKECPWWNGQACERYEVEA